MINFHNFMDKLLKIIFVASIICGLQYWGYSQVDSSDVDRMEDYQWRIQQRTLNDIYIPSDIDDAMVELGELSSENAIKKFKTAAEEEVARQLFFGLGKWITSNWQFYEGSRFSHYLRGLGLSHPDDMVIFVIESFHRYLHDKDLNVEERIEKLREERRKKARRIIQRDTLSIERVHPEGQ